MKLRIDKYLADMGAGTRTEIKTYIKKGLVSINGKIIKSPSEKADTVNDNVVFDGREIKYLEYEYYVINKPSGVISASEDNRQKTVIDLIEDRARNDLFPVGRLDKDTEGLLLITNDGMLAHNLLSPKKHVDKTYYVETQGMLADEHITMFADGLEVDSEFIAMPAVLEILSCEKGISKSLLTIKEGKFHQVKRMMAAVDNEVTYLKRISMGPIQLPDDLKTGEYRRLTIEEINILKDL